VAEPRPEPNAKPEPEPKQSARSNAPRPEPEAKGNPSSSTSNGLKAEFTAEPNLPKLPVKQGTQRSTNLSKSEPEPSADGLPQLPNRHKFANHSKAEPEPEAKPKLESVKNIISGARSVPQSRPEPVGAAEPEPKPISSSGGGGLHPMDCMDMIIGSVRVYNGKMVSNVGDYYSRDRSTPMYSNVIQNDFC
jgi:hypothetical protein